MGLEYFVKNFLTNRCKGREISEGSNIFSKISFSFLFTDPVTHLYYAFMLALHCYSKLNVGPSK